MRRSHPIAVAAVSTLRRAVRSARERRRRLLLDLRSLWNTVRPSALKAKLRPLWLPVRPWALLLAVWLRPRSVRLLRLRGEHLMARGRFGRARELFERAVKIDPDFFEGYAKIALIYHYEGKVVETVEFEKRAADVQARLARDSGLDQLGLEIVHGNFASVIGHMVQLDVFVKQQLLAGRPLEELLFLVAHRSSTNEAYTRKWLEHFPRVIGDVTMIETLRPVARLLRPVNFQAWRDFDGELRYYYAVSHAVQRRWEHEGRGPLLYLSDDERARGRAQLAELGVPEDAWFVPLHVREDRRDILLDSRNVDIGTYRQAIDAVVERGGWVIRMGDRSMTPLPPIEGVVDYVFTDAKSDWMDVFLWADCRFTIGTTSGPAGVPQTFGKPVLQTNWLIGYPYWYSGDIYLPRLFWSEREGRYLSFGEARSSPLGVTLLGSELARHGLRIRANTADELEEAVVEMIEQLEGRLELTPAEEEQRMRLESLPTLWGRPEPPHGARIGRGFLRRHAELLD